MRPLILFTLMLTVSACATVPAVEKPKPPIPAAFAPALATGGDAPANRLERDQMFRDPRLLQIIDLALDNNRDLRLALLNVETARSQSDLQNASRQPDIDAQISPNAERSRMQRNRKTELIMQNNLSLGLNAFEVDLFGRVRALSDAALARYLASEEGYQAARITLIGAVAETYFAERQAIEQLALAERTLEDWRQSLELARLRQRSGTDNDVDTIRAQAQVSLAESDLRARERAVMRAGNALRLVVGTDIPADLPPAMALDQGPVTTQLPAGLPSDLLLNRPDIRQAERTLEASNADVAAARAAFFPRLSLTAAFGFSSHALGSLFSMDSNTWSFSPRLVLPIFNGGRLDAELDIAKVRRNEAVAQYEKAIQTAFREVSDGLAGSATLGAQIDAQQRAVSQAKRAVTLAETRYRAGLEGRMELLDAQRQLQSAEQTLVSLRGEEITNAVALYKALGGGLAEQAPQPTGIPPATPAR